MHYGHPDVFDRVFHITRGGISKASRVINISEDIYSGMTAFSYKTNLMRNSFICLFILLCWFPKGVGTAAFVSHLKTVKYLAPVTSNWTC